MFEVASVEAEVSVESKEAVNGDEQVARKRPSKTIKKKWKYERKLEMYRKRKLEKKAKRREKANAKTEKQEENNDDGETKSEKVEFTEEVKKKHKIKRFERKNINEKLRKVHDESNSECASENLKICIDCSYLSLMNEKEQSRLGQQIGRCYASNRAAEIPAQIRLTSIDKESFFYKEMCRVNDGFERYVMIKSENSIEQMYANDLDTLIYLSPDGEKTLDTLDLSKVYVIGGLVDETVNKKVTLTKSENLKLNCYRLPIEQYMTRRSIENSGDKRYNFNKILALNHVLDILLNFNVTQDWRSALARGVPSRKGFFIEQKEDESKIKD